MNETTLHTIEGGGVASARGFVAGGIHAGFRHDPARLDMALIEADELAVAAGVFTQNVFCAAPVSVCREHLDGQGFGHARAVVVNSGIANAATGVVGLDNARACAKTIADVVGCAAEDVLVASTGIIGQQLDIAPFGPAARVLQEQFAQAKGAGASASPDAAASADPASASAYPVSASTITPDEAAMGIPSGAAAACAIMTTDTHSKEHAVSWVTADPAYAGATFTVGGMSKGSGMIMPNMATMIAVLTTDAPLTGAFLHQALTAAVNGSFNKVTVDGDTSTNDTCVILASGAAAPTGAPAIAPGTPAADEFCAALDAVCQNLARQMAADGEGATRLVTVHVRGAATPQDADAAARTVANSPLVKTALYGHDANWGRIAGALGRSGAAFSQENCDIDIMGLPVLRAGLPVPFSEEEALRRFEAPEIVLEANLGAGACETTMWTCDFSHEYVSINGDYRS